MNARDYSARLRELFREDRDFDSGPFRRPNRERAPRAKREERRRPREERAERAPLDFN